MLTERQRADFERDGILMLENAFTEEDAVAIRGVFWREMGNRYGVERDDPATWDRHLPNGLKSTKKSRAFDPIFGPVLRGALDALLGPDAWNDPKHMGQVLVTMPNATEWRLPERLWHSDFDPHFEKKGLFAVKWWTFFDTVEPGQAGTLQMAGGHALFSRFLQSCEDHEYKHARDTFLKSNDWLRGLTKDDGSPDRNERFMAESVVDGCPVRVVELTGAPGDVFITHPWVFHCISTNARATPRLMRSGAVYSKGAW